MLAETRGTVNEIPGIRRGFRGAAANPGGVFFAC